MDLGWSDEFADDGVREEDMNWLRTVLKGFVRAITVVVTTLGRVIQSTSAPLGGAEPPEMLSKPKDYRP